MSRRFGRLVQHDERSRAFPAKQAPVQRSVLHGHHAPVLDQGDLGSCTGNALAQMLNTDPFELARPGRYLTEADAVALYSAATRLDEFPGEYPPTDTGSSGLGVAKAGQKAGYFDAYAHTFSFDGFTSALQLQPVIVGSYWTDAMMDTDRYGFVSPSGRMVGGHEYVALGVDYEKQELTFLNSWSDQWGSAGRFKMTFSGFKYLLGAQGDVVAPGLPVAPEPAPEPEPQPEPEPAPQPDDPEKGCCEKIKRILAILGS